jgi:hypothetical protein
MTIAVRIEHTDYALRDKLINVGYMSKKGKKEPPASVLNYGDGVILHVYEQRDIYVEEVVDES